MGCKLCLCTKKGGGVARSGNLSISIETVKNEPTLRIEHAFYSEGKPRKITALFPIVFCPICGDRLKRSFQ